MGRVDNSLEARTARARSLIERCRAALVEHGPRFSDDLIPKLDTIEDWDAASWTADHLLLDVQFDSVAMAGSGYRIREVEVGQVLGWQAVRGFSISWDPEDGNEYDEEELGGIRASLVLAFVDVVQHALGDRVADALGNVDDVTVDACGACGEEWPCTTRQRGALVPLGELEQHVRVTMQP